MPDITLCENNDCPLKYTCYRFKAVPSEYQSYSDFKPDENDNCEYYIKIEEHENS